MGVHIGPCDLLSSTSASGSRKTLPPLERTERRLSTKQTKSQSRTRAAFQQLWPTWHVWWWVSITWRPPHSVLIDSWVGAERLLGSHKFNCKRSFHVMVTHNRLSHGLWSISTLLVNISLDVQDWYMWWQGLCGVHQTGKPVWVIWPMAELCRTQSHF